MRAIAVCFLTAGILMSCARAEDQIKPGLWEYSATVPGVSHLPPNVQPSHDVQIRSGPNGLSYVRTKCITAADPFPPMHRSGGACRIDTTDVTGGTIRWSATCATPEATLHEDWVIRYHGETLDGVFALESTISGHPPVQRMQPLGGRYLGPCPSN